MLCWQMFFALYLKTKNFHWHMSGPHFRDYHLLLDDHGDQIFAMTDDIAERVRKLGGTTIRSIGHIARLQRIPDNDADYVTAKDMLSELHEDEKALVLSMRAVHAFATTRAMLRPQACWRTGLTRGSGGAGSFSKRRAVSLHSASAAASGESQFRCRRRFFDFGCGIA